MKAGRHLALAVLSGGLALGVLAESLFRGEPLGANVPLWTLAFALVLAVLLRPARARLNQGRRFMIGPLLLFAGLFAWHDSPLLLAVNLLAIAAAVAVGALRRRAARLHPTGILDYAGGLVAAACAAVAGAFPLLLREIAWKEAWGGARTSQMAAVGRGIAIGTPLVILFGALFVAADAVFKGLVTGISRTSAIFPAGSRSSSAGAG